ncbi:hypothetical protein ACFYST_30630 [Kitasatospora sp. NPDC004614]|uniref:hypothetical protein n=1 Tax=unclassified Kitasatospora TaxID=2633591 RepID=UPI00369F5AE9
MNRHLASVPPPGDEPRYDVESLAVLVAAQLRAEQANALPAPVQPQSAPPANRYGGYIATGAGAAAVLIPVLLATTAALVAVGMAALALAVSALVIRWIIRDMRGEAR